jgi:hypothetical protein
MTPAWSLRAGIADSPADSTNAHGCSVREVVEYHLVDLRFDTHESDLTVMKTFNDSRRAVFLQEMLDAFESGDSLKLMDVANELQVKLWPIRWWVEGNDELSDSDQAVLGDMGKALKRLLGRGLSDQRVSVAPRWQNDEINQVWQECLDKLSPEAKPKFGSILEMIDLGVLDTLDARYAHEVVEVLRKIMSRIGTLDPLSDLSIPNRSVQLAFEEAHRCYLYGLPKACVALCRSTIEAGLRECLKTVEEKSTDELELCEMLRLQSVRSFLGSLHQSAQDVRIAGNHAVHYSDVFEVKYPTIKVQDIVNKTRKIVEHLYGLPKR